MGMVKTNQLRKSKKVDKTFWVSASRFYGSAIAIAVLGFFLGIVVFSGSTDESPIMAGGVISAGVLFVAIILREFVLRTTRANYFAAAQQLDDKVDLVRKMTPRKIRRGLTLEQNRQILKKIEKKSDAARTLRHHSDVHFEVFEICQEYLDVTKRELAKIDVNSPRLGGIRRGTRRVRRLHKYHLIEWAALKSGEYINRSQNCATIGQKIEYEKMAVEVLKFGIRFYPQDKKLTESRLMVQELLNSN